MEIQTLTTFFMWCTIINLGLLILTSIACIFLADFSYRMNNRFFFDFKRSIQHSNMLLRRII
jgi:amino acid transporter